MTLLAGSLRLPNPWNRSLCISKELESRFFIIKRRKSEALKDPRFRLDPFNHISLFAQESISRSQPTWDPTSGNESFDRRKGLKKEPAANFLRNQTTNKAPEGSLIRSSKLHIFYQRTALGLDLELFPDLRYSSSKGTAEVQTGSTEKERKKSQKSMKAQKSTILGRHRSILQCSSSSREPFASHLTLWQLPMKMIQLIYWTWYPSIRYAPHSNKLIYWVALDCLVKHFTRAPGSQEIPTPN